MRLTLQTRQRVLALLLVATVLLGTVPGLAAAEPRAGGVVTVPAGETVNDDLQAFAGTVVIAGTVNGDVEVAAGDVLVTGTVTGDLSGAAGSITVEGTVGGDVQAGAGSLTIADGGRVGGNVEGGVGDFRLDGAVDGDVRVGADTLTIGPTAVVGGNVEYDAGTFTLAPDAAVAGTVERNDDLVNVGVDAGPFAIPGYVAVAYGFLVNLLLGAVLLAVAPNFARRVVDVGSERALRSGGVGLLVVVGVPIALVLLLLTIVGIPLSLLGFVLFGLALWLGQVLGAYLLGTKGLALVDRETRWGALVLGLLVLALLNYVPVLGGVATFVLLLVGLGAMTLALYDRYGGDGDRRAPVGDEPTEGRPAA